MNGYYSLNIETFLYFIIKFQRNLFFLRFGLVRFCGDSLLSSRKVGILANLGHAPFFHSFVIFFHSFFHFIISILFLYLKSDVLPMGNYGLDPCWYYTSPGLSWDALLKTTNIYVSLF